MRYPEIDIQRTLCILSVVFLHAVLPWADYNPFWRVYAQDTDPFAAQVASFASFLIIPSFIFSAGFLFACCLELRPRSAQEIITGRSARLLFPWLIMAVLWLVPLYTIFDIPAYFREPGTSLAQGYAYALSGRFTDHLWFLLVLFWTSLFWAFFYPLAKRSGFRKGIVLAIGAALIDTYVFGGIHWFCLRQVGGPIIFFYLGCSAFTHKEALDAFLIRRPVRIFACLCLTLYVLAPLAYTNIPLWWLLGSIGALIMYLICLGISRQLYAKLRERPLYRFMDARSFSIYLFHMPIVLLVFQAQQVIAPGLSPWMAILFCFCASLGITLGLIRLLLRLLQKCPASSLPARIAFFIGLQQRGVEATTISSSCF